jgi:hypothetical protein
MYFSMEIGGFKIKGVTEISKNTELPVSSYTTAPEEFGAICIGCSPVTAGIQ